MELRDFWMTKYVGRREPKGRSGPVNACRRRVPPPRAAAACRRRVPPPRAAACRTKELLY